jgi:hypothetical protein
MRRLLPFALVAACGGTEKTTTFKPPPPSETHAALAGHRCSSTTYCACRQAGDDAEKTPPPEGHKRFEFRLATATGVAWVTIDGKDQLFKSKERAEDCFYVDLPHGKHAVALRAKAEHPQGGVGIGMHVAEHDPRGPSWYRSFGFQCGVPGPCDKDTMAAWKSAISSDRAKLRDPCGSTRVEGLGWETGRMPDAVHPEEISVSFTLNVHDYLPQRTPEDPDCSEI